MAVCSWCGRPLEVNENGKGTKGGRPRKQHRECGEVRSAFELLVRKVEAAEDVGLTVTPGGHGNALRREFIGLGWRIAPARIGKVDAE